MKFYITWHPVPPDPKYWKWFNPDGIAVSLANIDKKFIEQATTRGIHRLLGYHGPILLDSLTRQPTITPKHVLHLQSWMKPDIIVHRDYPITTKDPATRWKLLKLTLRNAEATLKWEEKTGTPVIYVIQGWNTKSFLWCAQKYLELGITRFGIGSSKLTQPQKLLKRVKAVREAVGEKAYLHVFGALKPTIIKQLANHADSIDSSSPIQAAIRKSIYIPTKDGIKRIKTDYVSAEDLKNMLDKNLRKKLPQIFTDENAPKMLKKSKDTRAIINAYVLTQYIRRISRQ